MSQLLQSLVKNKSIDSSSVVCDLGANKGQELQILAPLGCEIHSFEPHPLFASQLEEKYGSSKNIFLNNSAAWIANETRNLYFKISRNSANGGASLLKEKTNASPLEVNCIDIAQYIKDLDKTIDLLKMDIEGSEYKILNHLRLTGCLPYIKAIYFEDHSRKILDPAWRKLRREVLTTYRQEHPDLLHAWDNESLGDTERISL